MIALFFQAIGGLVVAGVIGIFAALAFVEGLAVINRRWYRRLEIREGGKTHYLDGPLTHVSAPDARTAIKRVLNYAAQIPVHRDWQ